MKNASIISFILVVLHFCCPPTSPSPTPLLNDQVLGLIVFKAGLHDPSSALSSWSPDDPSPCSWLHVTCSSSSSSVSSLSLSSLSLSSSSLPPGLDLLSSLRSLSLSSNSFSGDFPSSFPCSSLRFLSLSSNHFSGPIHPSLSRCSFLLHLNLSSNHLSGDFSFIFSSLTRLRVLDLSFNSLSGPLPDSIASLRNLKLLNLSGNKLSGGLPLSLAALPHLLSLDLARNQFSGEFPKWISFLTGLRRVDLSGNRLAGAIATNLSTLQNLSFLDLSFNSLTGDVPDSLADCLNLTELRLGGNALSGNIPPAIFRMGLKVLDLAGNKLGGAIPPVSDKLGNVLEILNLSGNRLVGEFPPEMTMFVHLQYLNLSLNYQLHSQLPPEIGEFKNLSVLDLRSSGFYGTIPGSICNSGSIDILQLDGNTFSGQIPQEMRNCSKLHLLSLSHNKLTGSIPAALSELKKLEILNLEFNSLSGEIPQQLGSLANLVAVNISNNRLIGRLPSTGVFPSLDQSALRGNLGLCSPLVSDEPCEMDEIPKPLVLDPNTINKGKGSKRGHRADKETESRHRRILSLSAIVAIAAAFIIFFGILAITFLNISARKRLEKALDSICSTSSRSGNAAAVGQMVNFGSKSPDFSNFTTESLLTKAAEIGRGAFGVVYRAAGPVAIRKFPPNCALQNHDDFDREVRALAKARHPNLLAIKGYYFTPQIQLLVTEFASGGSLDSRLHGGGFPLSWPERFHIALGTARGLAHLHRAFRPPVIHYNVKPSNILLDAAGEAKVADFGLNRLLRSRPDLQAVGYAASELACGSLRVSEKCDVYGFGIILLELVTGRKAVEVREDEMVMLVDKVMAELERGEAEDCVDRKMGGFVEEEAVPMLKLGLVCASQIPSSRPTMAEVVQILEVIKAPVIERMAAFS